jgi:8-oxo-dGTP pyrophosphatase MutT (NUDIX family)
MNRVALKIRDAIDQGLPGTDVQWEMASSDRLMKDYPRTRREGSKTAAVLVLLYPADGLIQTTFIQRPVYNGIHSGQISFPGGKAEPSDRDIISTALREAAEETGVNPAAVTVLGTLTPLFVHVSDTEVTPVVGWSEERPDFCIDPAEVVHIIEAPILTLADNSIIREKPFTVHNREVNIRYFDYQGAVIWGATAMILHELIIIMKNRETGFTA